MIIDEVQYAPRLFRHLKAVIDARRSRNGQFLLTGSQRFTLMKGVSESLAGRADVVELETFSLHELAPVRPSAIEPLIVQGGFPEFHANPDIDPVSFYSRISLRTSSATCGRWPTSEACAISSGFFARARCGPPTC